MTDEYAARDEQAISAIVARSVPPRTSLVARMVHMYRAVGLIGLFGGSENRVSAVAIVSVAMSAFSIVAFPGSPTAVAISAPIPFLLSAALIDGFDRVGRLARLRRSLLFSAEDITSLRVLIYAVVGLVCALVTGALSNGGTFLVGIAVSSLALSALLVLALLRSPSTAGAVLVLPFVWVAALLFAAPTESQWGPALASVPSGLWTIAGTVSLLIFVVFDARRARFALGKDSFHAARQ